MTLDSLLNGMKSLFSSLGAKTSDSNYGVALLDKTSGEPKGLMGMSDLASVLGGLINEITIKDLEDETNVDDVVPDISGIIINFLGDHKDGLPPSYSNAARCFLISMLYANYYGVQIVFDTTVGTKQAPYYRVRSGNTWSGVSWIEL